MGRHITVAELLPIGREFGVSLLPPRLLLKPAWKSNFVQTAENDLCASFLSSGTRAGARPSGAVRALRADPRQRLNQDKPLRKTDGQSDRGIDLNR